MPRGGARNRSGPQPDPKSGRSDRRNFALTALPAEGYTDDPPAFPFAALVLFDEYFEGTGKDRVKVKDHDSAATERFRDRELAVWAEAWATPQACAWSMAPWRQPVIAEYCRLKTTIEFEPSASAALVAQLHRYRDQLGLTPAGLKENGWAIAEAEVEADGDEPKPEAKKATTPKPRRLRAVDEVAS